MNAFSHEELASLQEGWDFEAKKASGRDGSLLHPYAAGAAPAAAWAAASSDGLHEIHHIVLPLLGVMAIACGLTWFLALRPSPWAPLVSEEGPPYCIASIWGHKAPSNKCS